ncbi:MAG: PHP domain-containing protein [Bacteroidales bacterium]
MKYYDNHIHSHFSPDSKLNIAQAVHKASEQQLGGIAFTDHYDIDAPCRENEF